MGLVAKASKRKDFLIFWCKRWAWSWSRCLNGRSPLLSARPAVISRRRL